MPPTRVRSAVRRNALMYGLYYIRDGRMQCAYRRALDAVGAVCHTRMQRRQRAAPNTVDQDL